MKNNMKTTDSAIDDKTAVKIARHTTWVGFWINAVLGVGKVIAGIFGRSSAMVADGVHSFSDFVTDLIVIIFVGISRRKADRRHQYGHGKYETFATMLVSAVLLLAGVLFFIDGMAKTIYAAKGHQLQAPTWLALSVAVISILVKEWLFHYTLRTGRRIGSSAVMANAWHHRSDSLSSLATVAGIAGAMFLGPRWHILDPLAAVAVSIFIVIVAVKIGRPAVMELLEVSLPEETTRQMYQTIGNTPGVEAFHRFASRRNGNLAIVDFHIKVDPHISVDQAHNIATDVEKRLTEAFGKNIVANIHIEPYEGQPVDANRMCR